RLVRYDLEDDLLEVGRAVVSVRRTPGVVRVPLEHDLRAARPGPDLPWSGQHGLAVEVGAQLGGRLGVHDRERLLREVLDEQVVGLGEVELDRQVVDDNYVLYWCEEASGDGALGRRVLGAEE